MITMITFLLIILGPIGAVCAYMSGASESQSSIILFGSPMMGIAYQIAIGWYYRKRTPDPEIDALEISNTYLLYGLFDTAESFLLGELEKNPHRQDLRDALAAIHAKSAVANQLI